LRYEPLRLTAEEDRANVRRQEAIFRALEDSPANRQRRRDRLLFGVELTALALLLVILGYGAWRLRVLNAEARQAQQASLARQMAAQPTPWVTVSSQEVPAPTAPPTEPPAPTSHEARGVPPHTPEATAGPTGSPLAVLPGERGTETPAPPLDVAPPSEPEPTPTVDLLKTPVPGAPRRMVIDKLGVDAPVVAGDTWEDLKQGIGHHPGSVGAGERGNLVVSAHNDIYGELFRHLDRLGPGDEVWIYTDEGGFRYVVRTVEIVEPTRVEVMDPTDEPILTMITCYPYLLDTHRVVVVADLAE